eukprot:5269752-Prymnesium_polylepis.1
MCIRDSWLVGALLPQRARARAQRCAAARERGCAGRGRGHDQIWRAERALGGRAGRERYAADALPRADPRVAAAGAHDLRRRLPDGAAARRDA